MGRRSSDPPINTLVFCTFLVCEFTEEGWGGVEWGGPKTVVRGGKWTPRGVPGVGVLLSPSDRNRERPPDPHTAGVGGPETRETGLFVPSFHIK